jgi:hypothetical protein
MSRCAIKRKKRPRDANYSTSERKVHYRVNDDGSANVKPSLKLILHELELIDGGTTFFLASTEKQSVEQIQKKSSKLPL